jgi:hypothetical protein
VQTLYASVLGNARAKKWEWGEGMGDFWESIGNVNEENTQFKKKKRNHFSADSFLGHSHSLENGINIKYN